MVSKSREEFSVIMEAPRLIEMQFSTSSGIMILSMRSKKRCKIVSARVLSVISKAKIENSSPPRRNFMSSPRKQSEIERATSRITLYQCYDRMHRCKT